MSATSRFVLRHMAPVILILLSAVPLRAADRLATWLGGGTDWSDPARWSTNPLFPNNGNGGFTYDVLISTGVVIIDQPIAIDGLNLSGGILRGSSTLRMSGQSEWSGGNVGSFGALTLRMVIEVDAFLNITGEELKDLASATIDNSGTAVWSGGGKLWNGNSFPINNTFFNNLEGGTFDVQSDGTLADSFHEIPKFNNAGLFKKSAGDGTTRLAGGWRFNNTGTVEVQTGTLDLGSGGASTGGEFKIAPGATLVLGGFYTLDADTVIDNQGTLEARLVTFNMAQVENHGEINIVGGIARFDEPGRLNGIVNLKNGLLGGTSVVTISDTLNWIDGRFTHVAIAPGAFLNITGEKTKNFVTATIDNSGTTVWSGGMIWNGTSTQNSNDTFFNNLEGGIFDVQSDGGVASSFNESPTFNNAGLFKKSAGDGRSWIGRRWRFNNTGTIEVQKGTLQIYSVQQLVGTSLTAGEWIVEDGASLLIPIGSNITANLATIRLHGPDSKFDKINALEENAGTLEIDQGRDFNTVGDFLNSGKLSIGTASAFTTSGDFSQAGAGSVSIEIGGLDAETEFGQLIVSGEVSLAGSLDVSFVDGFLPNVGDSFEVLTFSSRVGEFSEFGGLDLDGGLSLTPQYDEGNLTLIASRLSDLTGNGFVDFEDLTVLLANWNKNVGIEAGNLVNADTTPVNFEDLTVLLADWTGPVPAGSPEAPMGVAAVPEPSTLLLAVLATLGLSFSRRRRRRAF